MTEILNTIIEGGMGISALCVCVFIIWRQQDRDKEFFGMIDKMNGSINENTRVTAALAEKIERSMEVDKDVVNTIRTCKLKSHNR